MQQLELFFRTILEIIIIFTIIICFIKYNQLKDSVNNFTSQAQQTTSDLVRLLQR